MSKYIFDYDDGDFAMSISDSMAMDSDGNLMMRMGDHMAMDIDKENIFQDPDRESSGTGHIGLSRCLRVRADILP